MPELKRTFLKGRMNQDLDEILLPTGEYFDATNIQVSTSEGSDVGAIETVLGNTLQNARSGGTWNTNFGLTNPICIGTAKDNQNNKIYYFITEQSADASAILEYDPATAQTAVVIADVRADANQVLNFNANNLITGVNILDDMLFFTDNLNEPRKINISTFKAGSTANGPTINSTTGLFSGKDNSNIPFTAEDINVIKKAPKVAAKLELSSTLIADNDFNGVGINPLICAPIAITTANIDTVVTLNFKDNINSPAFFIGKTIILRAKIADDNGVRKNYIVKGIVNTASATQIGFTPSVIPQNLSSDAVNWSILVEEQDFIYKREFPRFSYRWKYEDGEYSSIAPFTEPAFIPGKYDYESINAENKSMYNHLRKIILTFPERLTTNGPPRGVEYVEVLYKTEKSNNIYIIKTAKLQTNIGIGTVDPSDPMPGNNFSGFFGSGGNIGDIVATEPNPVVTTIISGGEFTKFEITKELDGPIIESNQLLRLFDAVPKRALAQEIIANRIVYGNYTEGYDENDNPIVIENQVKSFKNFSGASSTGSADEAIGHRTIKSDKTYQLGVSFLDEFNRESPVLTNDNATVIIGQDRSHFINTIELSVKSAAPSWAKFYKYYIKDNYSQQHNLLLDRFYNAEDGNIWLSFPSAERNKVTEKDILVLKKQHGTSVPVVSDHEYKIIDISNSPPEGLRLSNLTAISSAVVVPVANNVRIAQEGSNIVRFNGPRDNENDSFFNNVNRAAALQFVRPDITPSSGGFRDDTLTFKSKIYKIKTGGSGFEGSNLAEHERYKIELEDNISSSDNWLGELGALSHTDGNAFEDGTESVEVILYGPEENLSLEFQGRFFVKVERNASFNVDIEVPSGQVEDNLVVLKATPPSAVGDRVVQGGTLTNYGNQLYPSFLQSLPATPNEVRVFKKSGKWFIGTSIYSSQTIDAYTFKRTVAQMAFESAFDSSGQFNGGNADIPTNDTGWTFIYGPTDADIDEVGAIFNSIVEGTKINFYNNNKSSFSQTYTVKTLSASTTFTAANTETYATKTLIFDKNFSTSDMAVANIAGVQILDETSKDLLVRNPAIFETKAEKNIDIDIFYEASDAIEIANLDKETTLKYSNAIAFGNGVESTDIADDFNAPSYGKGVRVSSILKKAFKEETRASDLIFSGIVNSRTDVNNSNQFIIAENITKSINPRHGSIQKLFARDGELLTLCEDKCFQILADKDALFNADGSAQLTASNRVLGQVIPFAGEFGISKNPESFVSYGFRSYFTDKSRGVVLRLSKNGLTEISEQGMSDYFEDKFTSFTGSLIGSYDESMGTYNLKVGTNESISYDEGNQGWCTRLTYGPEAAISLNNVYYSFSGGQIYKHNSTTRANFYGTQNTTTVTVIFNDVPSSIKNFKTIFYEGDSDWTVDLETDKQTGVTRGTINPDLNSRNSSQFYEREGKYYNFIGGDVLSWNNNNQADANNNLDDAEFSTQGIGLITGFSTRTEDVIGDPHQWIETSPGGGTETVATITFANTISLPSSLQVGDQFFFLDYSANPDAIYNLGVVYSITDTSSTTSIEVIQGLNVTGGIVAPEVNDFAFFVKDPRANTSGILGYFNKATFTNTGTSKNELFAVGTEVFISS